MFAWTSVPKYKDSCVGLLVHCCLGVHAYACKGVMHLPVGVDVNACKGVMHVPVGVHASACRGSCTCL